MNTTERNQLIDALLEGDISEADFLRLEAELSVDPAARQEYYSRLALSEFIRSEANASARPERKVIAMLHPVQRWLPALVSAAAVFVVLLAGFSVVMKPRASSPAAVSQVEEKASGFAVLTGQSDTVWEEPSPLPDGGLLPAGRLRLASGIAQIELFSGVTLVVEGEAEFEIVSPMEMTVLRGKVRARVPEPAHGFRIHTSEGEVVDLGTEFALNVTPANAEVHVFDGVVEWHPRTEAMRHLSEGEAIRWGADDKGTELAANSADFAGIGDLREKLASARQSRRENWERFRENLQRDPRLIAYYQMETAETGNLRLPNEAGGDASEGAIVAAARVADRWGTPAGALDFSPTGSRVRVSVPGEYRSLTLMTWVRINSLDRWYNSLFLTDGHDLHEPHWQIMDDGRLFFSVKHRDVLDRKKGGKDKHIFYSPPFWNASLSGQWLMIATVYDVDAKKVTHFLNGRALSQETIPSDYLVETVSIGAASIGNWSEPMYRKDAAFTIRNLNGGMDEFAIFAAALAPEEISEIYEHGKP